MKYLGSIIDKLKNFVFSTTAANLIRIMCILAVFIALEISFILAYTAYDMLKSGDTYIARGSYATSDTHNR